MAAAQRKLSTRGAEASHQLVGDISLRGRRAERTDDARTMPIAGAEFWISSGKPQPLAIGQRDTLRPCGPMPLWRLCRNA